MRHFVALHKGWTLMLYKLLRKITVDNTSPVPTIDFKVCYGLIDKEKRLT